MVILRSVTDYYAWEVYFAHVKMDLVSKVVCVINIYICFQIQFCCAEEIKEDVFNTTAAIEDIPVKIAKSGISQSIIKQN